ncbi:MAG: bacteriohemerythrin [Thermoguttaceae bacterium]
MAEYILWRPNFSVGNDSLDTEHKVVIGLINELYAAVSANAPDVDLKAVMDRVIRYTITHFQHEEQVMLECGFPDIQAHKLLHERLRKRTIDFRDNLTLVTARDLLLFLKDWWCAHIQEKDKGYTPYLEMAVH